jgi:N-methylhydantoinase B/oxoprolinase/acetone carboxylase alpha subunit
LWDGLPGEPGSYLLRLPGENDFKPMVGAHIPVPVSSEAIVRTGGGGGWGDPLDRDPEAVRHDVMEEYISPESARDTYGVILRKDGTIDPAATTRQRSALRSAPRDAGGSG